MRKMCLLFSLKIGFGGPSKPVLRHWNVDFDPYHATISIMKIWVILSGLPFVFCNKSSLEAIGGKLGRFMVLESQWKSKYDRQWAWILLEVDIIEGLIGEVELIFREHWWN
jgi:hypothetical protein